MNDELLNGVYVIKTHYTDPWGKKKGAYLAQNGGAHFLTYYGNVKLDDFYLLPTKYNKRKDATWLSAALCSDLLKQLYEEKSPDGLKVYKCCLVRKLSIKEAKKKLNTKKARKNRFLVQKVGDNWTFYSNNIEYYPEWQYTKPMNLEQAVKIAAECEKCKNAKRYILMTGWRKLSTCEVEQLVNWQ